MDVGSFFVLLLILLVVTVVILWTTIIQIEQYEAGVALRLGKFYAMLNPGWNFVVPLITVVFKIDLRIQVLDVPRQEVITKDNSPTMVDAVVYYRVADANLCWLCRDAEMVCRTTNPKRGGMYYWIT